MIAFPLRFPVEAARLFHVGLLLVERRLIRGLWRLGIQRRYIAELLDDRFAVLVIVPDFGEPRRVDSLRSRKPAMQVGL